MIPLAPPALARRDPAPFVRGRKCASSSTAMTSSETKPPRINDVRTIERNIKKGNITRKDYEKYLKALPDVTDKVAPPEADDADDDLDEVEADETDDAKP